MRSHIKCANTFTINQFNCSFVYFTIKFKFDGLFNSFVLGKTNSQVSM